MPSTKPAADGPRPVPAGGGAGDRVGRGDERIGAVIDVEQHALRAFEQDPPPARARLVERAARPAGRSAARNRRSRARSRDQPRRGRSAARRSRRAARRDGRRGGRAAARARRDGRGRRPGSRGGRPCPHRPGRCRARWCRSCRRREASSRSASRSRWNGRISGQLSAICRRLGSDRRRPARASLLDLGLERPGIEHDAIADHRQRAADDARGQQRQFVDLVADDQRVAGIVAALEADDDVGAAGEPVDDLALALVAPLGADHGDIRQSCLLSLLDRAPLYEGRRGSVQPSLRRGGTRTLSEVNETLGAAGR